MTYEPVTLEHLLEHRSWAIALARRLVHGEGEAEELVQRTWIAALRRPPDRVRGVRSWMRTVLLNLARERHRRERTRLHHEIAALAPRAPELDAPEALSRTETHELLARRLRALEEPFRSVLTLRYYEELSSAEIARRMGVPAGTVRWRLKVGLERLREDLDRASNGDRSRWVSALLFAFPDAARAPEPAAARPAATVSWAPLVGTGLAVGLLGLGSFLWSERAGRDARAAALAPPPLVFVEGPAAAPEAGAPAPLAEALVPLPARADAAPEPPAAVVDALELTVVVVDDERRTVPGSRVLVYDGQDFVARGLTDAAGMARIACAPSDVGTMGVVATRDRISVRALAAGYAASQVHHVGEPFTRDHVVQVQLPGRGRAASGRVVDPEGRPIPGALVAWVERQERVRNAVAGDFAGPYYLKTITDAAGEFALDNLPIDGHSVLCAAEGYVFLWFALDSGSGSGGELVLQLSRGASVAGVARWPDGRPAAGARLHFEPIHKSREWCEGLPGYDLECWGFSEETRSAADGSFEIRGVQPGTRRLWARDETSGELDQVLLELAEEKAERWDALLQPHDGYRLRLVDEHARPLAGWFAHLRRPGDDSMWNRRVRADAEGRVVVPEALDGVASLDAFDPSGLGASYATWQVYPGPREETVVIDTGNQGLVSGMLLDASGQPLVVGYLSFYSHRTATSARTERTEDGRFSQRLAPGDWGLVFTQGNGSTRLIRFTLGPGQVLDLGTLSAPPTATLRLRAPPPTGEEPRYYTLSAVYPGPRHEKLLHVGTGEIEGEPVLTVFPGRYRVRGTGFDGAPRVRTVDVTAYEETLVDLGE